MEYNIVPTVVLHWNYRGFTAFPLQEIKGKENEVTDIYFKENLVSILPPEISRLERLESLYLSGNEIIELPKEIAQLKCLKCLDISGNRLRRLPEEIGDVRSLKYLIIDENELVDLPLRLGELRGLRYLSVCDNKLRWLPQKPFYNYYHCEFRFWRNPELKSIPYSIWYHTLRDQLPLSLNIGCQSNIQYQNHCDRSRCRLKFQNESRIWEVDVTVPPNYTTIHERGRNNPPSLFELSKRIFYKRIKEVSDKKSDITVSLYQDYRYEISNLERNFNGILYDSPLKANGNRSQNHPYYVTSDIVEELFCYLPSFIKEDLCNGPVSKCENVKCKMPIFDYVTYEFCLGKIILGENTEELLLSAAFCSQSCANVWRGGKTNVIVPWTLKY